MFKKIFLSILLTTLSTMPFLTHAQQANDKLAYGEKVSGEITNRNFEIPYDFTGKKGDIIIVEMQPEEKLGDLNSPAIILLDTDGSVLADTSGTFSIGSAVLATQLKTDGTYTILATRNDGRAGDSVGKFSLELIQPAMLKVKEPIKDLISSKDETKYYLIQGGSDTLSLSYHKISGKFSPEISVNIITDSFGLSDIITLKGDYLTKGQVTIPSAKAPFIVKIGAALFDFQFEEVTANYELMATIEN